MNMSTFTMFIHIAYGSIGFVYVTALPVTKQCPEKSEKWIDSQTVEHLSSNCRYSVYVVDTTVAKSVSESKGSRNVDSKVNGRCQYMMSEYIHADNVQRVPGHVNEAVLKDKGDESECAPIIIDRHFFKRKPNGAYVEEWIPIVVGFRHVLKS